MPTMKRFLGGLSRRSSTLNANDSPEQSDDSPEGNIAHEIKTFVESSNSPTSHGSEFVHLPRIVEIAESSPAATKEASVRIRKYLTTPSNAPSYYQYNAIMLMRILVDNPGDSFTRNIDTKFVANVKDLIRYGRDYHVQNYLRQYLDQLQSSHGSDENLVPLLRMWDTEKSKGKKSFADRFPQVSNAPRHQNQRQNSGFGQPSSQALPDAGELAARVEEARNSAKLLTQFVQTTSVADMEDNDLIKEFVDRCRTSSRFLQQYIHATNPSPDEGTLLTLIETNDEISVALSQQQRAMLRARKARGTSAPNSGVTSPVSSPGDAAAVASGANSTASPVATPVAAPVAAPVSPVSTANTREPEQTVPRKPLGEIDSTATDGRGNASHARQESVEYNDADFEVRNPFADDYETNEDAHPHKPVGIAGENGDAAKRDSRLRLEHKEEEH